MENFIFYAAYSPSGDTDIIALAYPLLSEYNERVILTDSHGQNQEQISSGSHESEDSTKATTRGAL